MRTLFLANIIYWHGYLIYVCVLVRQSEYSANSEDRYDLMEEGRMHIKPSIDMEINEDRDMDEGMNRVCQAH